jgi:hypothetical protein
LGSFAHFTTPTSHLTRLGFVRAFSIAHFTPGPA